MRSSWWLNVTLIILIIPVSFPMYPYSEITQEIPFPIPGDISAALHSLSSGPFIENRGQWDPSIIYVISTEYGKMALAKDGIYHWVHKFERRETDPIEDAPEFEMIDSCLIKALFEGGSPSSVQGEDPVQTRYNFFLGNDSSRWASDVLGYGSVLYTDVWSGIDIHYYQKEGRVKYDLLLSPGADPDLIRMRIEGAGSIRNDGVDLIISTPMGVDLLDSGLVSYYTTGEHIPSSFLLEGNIYGFDIGPYDRTRSIVIDPEYRMNALNYSVTIGGIDEEKAYDIEIDNEGNIYACGWTSSSNFPVTPNAYQKNKFFSADAIVFILEAKGEKLISSTFIGGDKADMALVLRQSKN